MPDHDIILKALEYFLNEPMDKGRNLSSWKHENGENSIIDLIDAINTQAPTWGENNPLALIYTYIFPHEIEVVKAEYARVERELPNFVKFLEDQFLVMSAFASASEVRSGAPRTGFDEPDIDDEVIKDLERL